MSKAESSGPPKAAAANTKGARELVRAAETIEEELETLEALSIAVRKIRLDSEKSIARAAKQLNEVLALPERLTSALGELATAMQRMQARQQAAIDLVAAYATELQRRQRRLEEHMAAFSALGKAAGEATARLQSESERTVAIDEVLAELTQIVDGARTLFEAARADDFHDVAREADVLKQRVTALRTALGQAQKSAQSRPSN